MSSELYQKLEAETKTTLSVALKRVDETLTRVENRQKDVQAAMLRNMAGSLQVPAPKEVIAPASEPETK